jgi:hypothetical protein
MYLILIELARPGLKQSRYRKLYYPIPVIVSIMYTIKIVVVPSLVKDVTIPMNAATRFTHRTQ